MWDKVTAYWDAAASYASQGWAWVNTYTNGPLLAMLALLVAVGFLSCGSAQAQGVPDYPALIDMEADVWPVYTNNPRVIVFCEANPGADEVHLCQAWGMPAPGVIIPVSGAVYCHVIQEKEVVREDESGTQRQWGCGVDRSEIADEATRVGKEVKRWGRPIRPGETEVAI
jgi:hypothetical protein